jgi:hypothetical protein
VPSESEVPCQKPCAPFEAERMPSVHPDKDTPEKSALGTEGYAVSGDDPGRFRTHGYGN